MLRLVTPPAPFVSVADAKRQLNVEHGDDDVLIAGLIDAAIGMLDGVDGWLGRAIGLQTWRFSPDAPGFSQDPASIASPCWIRGRSGFGLRLPLPPLAAIDAVTYRDEAGTEQTFDPDLYMAFGIGDRAGGGLVLMPGATWPTTWAAPEPVSVTFQAGYAPERLPPAIRQAALMIVTDLYAARGEKVNVNLAEDPTIKALLQPFRVYE